jgi:hypothetical protein
MLCQQTIIDFQNLYRNKTGVDLPDLEAEVMVMDLLKFMRMVYKPIRKGDIKNENDR